MEDIVDILKTIFGVFVLNFYIFMLIYAFFQIRQVKVLQGKIKTEFDKIFPIYSFIYFLAISSFFILSVLILFVF